MCRPQPTGLHWARLPALLALLSALWLHLGRRRGEGGAALAWYQRTELGRPPEEVQTYLGECLAKKNSSSSRVVYIQIGANDLAHVWEGPVYEALARHAFSYTALLVEPTPFVLSYTQRSLHRYGLNTSNVQVVNAALCEEDKLRVPFYSFDPDRVPDQVRALFHHVDPHMMQDRVNPTMLKFSAFSREAVRQGIAWQCSMWRNSVLHSEEQHALCLSLVHAVVAIQVRCVAAATLLSEAAVNAAEVDAFMVDAEGFESEILAGFFALPDFAPSWVKADVWGSTLTQELLAQRGYKLHRLGHDVYALRGDGCL